MSDIELRLACAALAVELLSNAPIGEDDQLRDPIALADRFVTWIKGVPDA